MPPTVATKIEAFFGRYPKRSFDKKEVLVHAHMDPPGVFYLVKGHVIEYDISPNGNDIVVNIFKPGTFFPMSWAINRTPNQYFFEAATSVVVRVAPASDAVAFVQDNPDVAFDLLARVYKGTDGVLRRMAHLMGSTAKSRLLFEIQNARLRFGEPTPQGGALVAINESDLAKQSGLARETVNRIMQQLKHEGMLTITRQGVVIEDIGKLESALGEHL